MLGLLMSLHFVMVQICVHVVEYDWHMPTVDCCIEYIARYNAVKGDGQFVPRNKSYVAQMRSCIPLLSCKLLLFFFLE